jgi:hypothetical protein
MSMSRARPLCKRTTTAAVVAALLCICIMTGDRAAAAPAATRLALLPPRDPSVGSNLGGAASRVEAALVEAVREMPGFTVVNLANGRLTAPRRAEARFEAQPSARALVLGKESGADRAVAVEATPLGDGLVVYLQALEVASGRAVGSTTFSLAGGETRDPSDAIAARGALSRILDPTRYVGRLALKLDVQDAEVQLDGRKVQPGNIVLAVGTHALRVTHPAYRDFLRFLDIEFDKTTSVAVNMAAYPLAEGEMTERQRRGQPIPQRVLPWYRRWWALAGAGVALTGVTIGVVWLARPQLHTDSSAVFNPAPRP